VRADTDYNNTVLNITGNTTLSGYLYNISTFYVTPNATITIDAFNGTDKGYLKINATRIFIYGDILGDGRGYGGGSGGGGGGAWGSGSSGAGGALGGPTDQNGTNGTAGNKPASACSGGSNAGGVGGASGNGVSGGAGSAAGSNATGTNDTTLAINATLGGGGGGGGGGNGGVCNPNSGGGGGGGGMGGDGGAYLVLVAKTTLIMNGTLNERAGQNASCGSAHAGGNQAGFNGGAGGYGANNSFPDCAATPGAGAGGSNGIDGGPGGKGAGGSIIIAGYTVNLTNARLNVTGGTATNGGTIKVLYRNTSVNGSYNGYAALVISNITDDFFQPDITPEDAARQAIIHGLDTSELSGNYSAVQDQQLIIRLVNGTKYQGRFDFYIVNGNKRWAINYDPNNNLSALPVFANITPAFYTWQRINLSSTNITNSVSAFINGTYP
jgi:hypothetical protein